MILRLLLPLVIVATVCLRAGAAHASGDFACDPTWKLAKSVYSDCDDVPFLSPGNDSRVNLQLLLIDAGRAKLGPPPPPDPPTDPPAPPISGSAAPFTLGAFSALLGAKVPAADDPDYASGEGSRCRSNASGAAAFVTALGASAVPAAEAAILADARKAVSPDCDDAAPAGAYQVPAGVRSAPGRQFAAYLAGVAEFYGGDYDDARRDFQAAAASPQPWLKQTARYMLARVALNKAQATAFDEYGVLSTDKVDAAALKESDAAFHAYLGAYPAGLYAASAQGLLRRVAWLGGRPRQLAADYAWAFGHAGPAERNVAVSDLVVEADMKLLTQAAPADIADPMLLAVRDLMAMRRDPASKTPDASLIKYDDLAAQRPTFAAQPELFEFLLAAHRFYVEADPAGALGHLGPAPPNGPMSGLAFSRQVLRGMAIEAQKDRAGARALWLRMIPLARPAFQRPLLDLALAMNEERDGRLAQVFAAGSTIHDPQVREILLRNDAPPALLIRQIKAGVPGRERRVALYTLLFKDMTRGRYAAFAGDSGPEVPPAPAHADPNDPMGAEPDLKVVRWPGHKTGYLCEPLDALARALAAAPQSPHGLLCLGEFVRLNGLDGDAMNKGRPADELGGAPTLFPGRPFARLDAYETLIADPKTPPGERAYALYRAVNCYAPAGDNGCDGKGAPKGERARWFHTLKTDYPKSEWALALKYYW
ncbi:MAG TPA: hypothetical protein VGG29_02065 [Caulobacteraceae bacterium]|jgi:hypothetical protein